MHLIYKNTTWSSSSKIVSSIIWRTRKNSKRNGVSKVVCSIISATSVPAVNRERVLRAACSSPPIPGEKSHLAPTEVSIPHLWNDSPGKRVWNISLSKGFGTWLFSSTVLIYISSMSDCPLAINCIKSGTISFFYISMSNSRNHIDSSCCLMSSPALSRRNTCSREQFHERNPLEAGLELAELLISRLHTGYANRWREFTCALHYEFVLSLFYTLMKESIRINIVMIMLATWVIRVITIKTSMIEEKEEVR